MSLQPANLASLLDRVGAAVASLPAAAGSTRQELRARLVQEARGQGLPEPEAGRLFDALLDLAGSAGPADDRPASTPVPPEVVAAALASFDEQFILDELHKLYEHGGYTLADFRPELERIVRSGG